MFLTPVYTIGKLHLYFKVMSSVSHLSCTCYESVNDQSHVSHLQRKFD